MERFTNVFGIEPSQGSHQPHGSLVLGDERLAHSIWNRWVILDDGFGLGEIKRQILLSLIVYIVHFGPALLVCFDFVVRLLWAVWAGDS